MRFQGPESTRKLRRRDRGEERPVQTLETMMKMMQSARGIGLVDEAGKRPGEKHHL